MKFNDDLVDALLFLAFGKRVDFVEFTTTGTEKLLFAQLL